MEGKTGIYSKLDNWLFIFFAMPLLMAPISTAGSSISGALFMLTYLASGYWKNWREAVIRPWFWPLVGLFSINFIGMLWTVDISRGWVIISKLNYFLFALAGATLPWKKKYFKWVVTLFLLGLLVNAFIGLLQFLNLFPWNPMDPGSGPIGYSDRTYLSLALANALFWLAYDFKYQVIFSKKWNGVLAVLFFIQLVSTGGRTGQISFFVLFPFVLWILFPGWWRTWIIGLPVLLLIGLASSPMVHARFLNAVDDLKQYKAGFASTSLGLRIVFWEGAFKMVEERPFFGVGTGDYRIKMASLQETHSIPQTPGVKVLDHPHNSYLAYLADLGIVGLICLIWFLFATLKEAWLVRAGPAAWFKLCYLGIFLVGSFFDTLIWGHDHAFALALIAAIPNAVEVV